MGKMIARQRRDRARDKCGGASHVRGYHFPPQLHVFVRDWLSANNVLLKSRDGHVLIDTGYVRHAPLTLALLASRAASAPSRLRGSSTRIAIRTTSAATPRSSRKYGCPVAVPRGEAPLVERWDEKALLYDYCDQRADRFTVDQALGPDTTHVWGDLEWRALAAPGHDMEALVFHNAEHGILVSGDALWENGFGFVMPPEVDPAALPATRATIEMIAALDVRVVIPGHGEPFTDVAAALDRAAPRRGVRSRQLARRPPRAQGEPHLHAARPAAARARRNCRPMSIGSASTATSTGSSSAFRHRSLPRCWCGELENAGRRQARGRLARAERQWR